MGRCLRWCLDQHLEIVEAWMIGKARLEYLMELQVNHICWRQDESMECSGWKCDLWMCSHPEVESSGLRCCGGKDRLVKYYTVALVLIIFENHQDLAWPPFLERMQLFWFYRILTASKQANASTLMKIWPLIPNPSSLPCSRAKDFSLKELLRCCEYKLIVSIHRHQRGEKARYLPFSQKLSSSLRGLLGFCELAFMA